MSCHAQRRGTRRWRAKLRAARYAGGRCALRTWLRRRGLRALSTRPQRPRTTQAEAGCSTLKTELLLYGGAFARLAEARLEVAYYLDAYCKLDRRHSAPGYRSPYQVERDFQISLS